MTGWILPATTLAPSGQGFKLRVPPSSLVRSPAFCPVLRLHGSSSLTCVLIGTTYPVTDSPGSFHAHFSNISPRTLMMIGLHFSPSSSPRRGWSSHRLQLWRNPRPSTGAHSGRGRVSLGILSRPRNPNDCRAKTSLISFLAGVRTCHDNSTPLLRQSRSDISPSA